MTSPQTPTKYRGPNVYIANWVTRDRRPTLADFRQPETGRLYPIFCGWQVSKNPVNGAEGELWMLSKIVANQGYWVRIDNGGGALLTLTGDFGGTVFPDGAGNIDALGTYTYVDNILGIQTTGNRLPNLLEVQLTNRMADFGTTVGAVAINIISFPPTTPLLDGTYRLKYEITAFSVTDLTLGASFEMLLTVVVGGGTPSVVGRPVRTMDGSVEIFSVNQIEINIFSQRVRLEVTGVAGTTIRWVAILNYSYVGA